MTKTVWVFDRTDEQFEDYDELRAAIERYVDNNTDEVEYWVNEEYGSIDICGNCYDAYDILYKFDDEGDASERFVEYLMDNEVSEEDVPVGYVFDLDGSDKIYDTEEEAGQAAKEYAISTFEDWLDCGRDTRVKLSTVLHGYLDLDQYQRLYECYEEQVLNYVREAESEDE